MTPEELDTIEKRANEATPGPWKFTFGDGVMAWVQEASADDATSMGLVAWVPPHGHERSEKQIRDGYFIACAREDIARLVGEVRQYRALLDAANAVARVLGDGCWFDHNGDCQAHFGGSPCVVNDLRRAILECSTTPKNTQP